MLLLNQISKMGQALRETPPPPFSGPCDFLFLSIDSVSFPMVQLLTGPCALMPSKEPDKQSA